MTPIVCVNHVYLYKSERGTSCQTEKKILLVISMLKVVQSGSPCICSRYTGRTRLSQSRETAEAAQMLT